MGLHKWSICVICTNCKWVYTNGPFVSFVQIVNGFTQMVHLYHLYNLYTIWGTYKITSAQNNRTRESEEIGPNRQGLIGDGYLSSKAYTNHTNCTNCTICTNCKWVYTNGPFVSFVQIVNGFTQMVHLCHLYKL